MTFSRYLATAGLALGLAGCDTLTVPDLNNPGLESLTENPTRSAVIAAAHGLFIDARFGIAGRAGYVSSLGILGRESYNFDPSDPRFVTELLIGPLDGGSPAFGGNHWGVRYTGFRDANNVLNALDAVGAQMEDAEKAALRGFAKTLAALDLLLVINTRDENGAVIAVNDDPTAEPPPIVSKDEVFQEIVRLLDDAVTDLQAAGGSFPPDFLLPPGLALANTPDDFIAFNRALRARVDVYRGQFANALGTLAASFLDPGGDLSTGVYYNYGTGAGETANGLFDLSNVLLAHPSIETDAQNQPGGEPDQRFLDKIARLPEAVRDQASQGISSDLVFTLYTSASAPVPIVRNEELILLRAEANLGAGNPDAALPDINLIRTSAGGLAPIDLATWQGMTDEERLDELLYNKRYSLLYEGGHRWIDMRRYGKLDELPLDRPGFRVAERYPFPQRECDARATPPAQGC